MKQTKSGFEVSNGGFRSGGLTDSSRSLELVSFPAYAQNDGAFPHSVPAEEYADRRPDADFERESRQLKRALVHAMVFLARAPFLIEEAGKAVQDRDKEFLRRHARTLRRSAWHVTRGRIVRQIEELDNAATNGDFQRAGDLIQELTPDLSLLISRLSLLLSS